MNSLKITFSGRMRRKTYWLSALYFSLVMILIFALSLIPKLTIFAMVIQVIALLYLSLLGLSYTVRRLHDIGKPGSYFLISFIPVVGGILLLIATLTDSVPGSNQYGPNPKGIH